jgi:hypothetical protein
MAGLPYDGPGWISSNMDREQELQHPAQAEQHLAEGAEHIKWQREVVAILERISTSAEAIEGARALLTTFLETQARREQDRDRIRASLDCNLDSSSTVVGGVAGPHLGADQAPVQLKAKLADLGEGRPSETASFDAVSQDEAADYRLRSQSITGTSLLGLLPEIQRTVRRQDLAAASAGKTPNSARKSSLSLLPFRSELGFQLKPPAQRRAQGVEMRPPLVATIQRPPHRTIALTGPTPGTVSPRVPVQTPSGPSKIALPPTTSRTLQPSIVVGFVSGNDIGLFDVVGPRPTPETADPGDILCWAAAGRRPALCVKSSRRAGTLPAGVAVLYLFSTAGGDFSSVSGVP